MTKLKQLSCPHWEKESLKRSVYTYKLIDSELNLCLKCERKLYKDILNQKEVEKESKK